MVGRLPILELAKPTLSDQFPSRYWRSQGMELTELSLFFNKIARNFQRNCRGTEADWLNTAKFRPGSGSGSVVSY
jgi:hypothetical protein